MRITHDRNNERPCPSPAKCSVWLLAGLLVAQQAGAWPDLRIVKTGPATAAPGDVITYTLRYTNAGPVRSTSVVMKDFLPANTAALTNTLNGGSLSGSTISWSLGSLNSRAGGSRSFQVRISTNAQSGSTVTNRSQIFGSEAEENGKTNDNFCTFITAILSTNCVPVAQDDNYATPEDTALVVPAPGVLANDSDANGDALTAALVTGPTQGALALNANGGFTYMPNTNFSGVDSFTYRASDGQANSGIATVTITVTPVNDPPIARDDQYSTPEDTSVTISAPGVLSNDSDPDGDSLAAILTTPPGNGQASLNSNGSFTYTPNANFNGVDSFTYRASDGITSSTLATVSITVTAVNDPPVAQNDAYPVNENATLTITAPGVLANDSDPDGNVLTAILVTGPTQGVLSLEPGGSFTYRPNSNYFGTDTFSYRANDGSADSAIALVTITVLPVNYPPLAQNDQYSTPEDTALMVSAPGVLLNDSDADNDALTSVLASTPTNGSVTLNADGGFIYTPNTNFNGIDSFTYRASDGITNSALATVAITVTGVNDAPIARNDQYQTPQDTVLSVSVPGVLENDFDPDGDVLAASLVTSTTNGQLTLNFDGSFNYTPKSNFFGIDAFIYRAGDGVADSSNALVTITVLKVNHAPVAQNDQYATLEDTALVVNAPGVLLNDSDSDNDPITSQLVTNPLNGSVSLDSDGGFIYTPNTNFYGVDSFSYRASDGITNSQVATVSITVTAINDPPVAQNDQYSSPEDTVLVVPLPGVLANDSDPDGDPLAVSLVSSSTNGLLSLNPNGSFTYQPNTNFAGTDAFTYRASDGKTNSGVAMVTITVAGINDPPIVANDQYSTPEDTALVIAAPGVLANDSDPDGDTLTAIPATNPSHGTLTFNPNGSFTYTPNTNFAGVDTFTYRASDGMTNSAIATVTINVIGTNDAPMAQDDQYSTLEDTALAVPLPGVLANDNDPDGDSLTARIATLPANGQVTLNLDGSFTYTPNTNFAGVDTFTYRASDGMTNSGIATVTINVSGTNDAPIARDDQYSTPLDSVLVISVPGVLANDSDPEGDPLSALLASNPAHGALVLDANGSFTYAPDTNFTGVDSFTYRAQDGEANSSLATVSIAVMPVNHPPAARDDTYSVGEDTRLLIAAPGVLVNDTDSDGDALTAVLVSSPAHGLLSLTADGGFSYLPNTNFNGADSFTYLAHDGITNSGVATVSITVNATNDPPLVQDDHYVTEEDTVLVVAAPGVLLNDSDPEGDSLTAAIATFPTNGLLTFNANGGFTYTPNTNFFGVDTFTYRANDGQLDSAVATVTIEVTGVYDPPNTNNWSGQSFTTYEDVVLDVPPPGVLRGIVGLDGNALKAALLRRITNGTINLELDGSFRLTPRTNFNGVDAFEFEVVNGQSNNPTLKVDITVLPVNDPPSFVKGDNVRLPQNAGPQVVPGWASNISPGPSDESGQLVTFQVSNDNSSLFSVQPTLATNGTLTFTPATGLSGTAIVTVIARDDGGTANGGVDASDPQTFSITVNAPPTVQIVNPTNGASFFVPGAFTVLADAQDTDGTVVKVEFFSGTNKVAEAAAGPPFFTVLTNLPVGSYTLGALATDDFGATGAATPVTVSVIERPPLVSVTSVYYNPQRDIFEQRIRVTNPTYSTLNAVRVLVLNLTNNPPITVGNLSGYTNGIPYVQSSGVVPPGGYVDLTIEYLSPMRIMPNPVLRAELVAPAGPVPPLPGTYQHINRGLLLANRTYLVEFLTQSNRVYSIQYSEDLINWKTSAPAIAGDGSWIQWIDNGEPRTEGSPAAAPARFYRLILLP